MKSKRLAFMGSLSYDEKIFVSMIYDRIIAAQENFKSGYTFFLGEEKLRLAEQTAAAMSFESFMLYGGYDEAQRVIMGIFPSGDKPDKADFPIKALKLSFRKGGGLTHRDFLGAILSLGIERDTIGDINVGDDCAYVFAHETAACQILLELNRVGRESVSVSEDFALEQMPGRRFESISGTLSSFRIDSVVSLALKCSRKKAQELVEAGLVSINGRVVCKVSAKVNESDSFSVRGHGKFILDEIGKTTKKERTFIGLKKFI
ncbi:MAG: YlmH/Sll1252 family protein [Ruminococcus sp.]|nr:YlmH/Sll1252 family protein [Ruminococcus sp.]